MLRRVVVAAGQRRCLSALGRIASETRPGTPSVGGQYTRLHHALRTVRAQDSLHPFLKKLEHLGKHELPEVAPFLKMLETKLDMSDMQLLQIGLWWVKAGHVQRDAFDDFSAALSAHGRASFRTYSLLCHHAAKTDNPKAMFHHLRTLLTLGENYRRQVKWVKLLPAVFRSLREEDVAELLRCVESVQSMDVLHAFVEAAVQTKPAMFRQIVASAGPHYPTHTAEHAVHVLLAELAVGKDSVALKPLLERVMSLVASPAETYPQLMKAVRSSRLGESEKVACYLVLKRESRSRRSNDTKGGEKKNVLCYEHKLGMCKNSSCVKIHQLVKCPQGDACTRDRCPYVHSTEIAWRWAQEELTQGAPDAKAPPQPVEVQAPSPPSPSKPSARPRPPPPTAEEMEKAKMYREEKKAIRAQAIATAKAKAKAKKEAKVDRASSLKESHVMHDLAAGIVLPHRALTKKEDSDVLRLQKMLTMLKGVDRANDVRRQKQRAPDQLVATYKRTSVADLVKQAKQETARSRLLASCNEGSEAPPEKLPHFFAETHAARTESLLSIVEGACDDVARPRDQPSARKPEKAESEWYVHKHASHPHTTQQVQRLLQHSQAVLAFRPEGPNKNPTDFSLCLCLSPPTPLPSSIPFPHSKQW